MSSLNFFFLGGEGGSKPFLYIEKCFNCIRITFPFSSFQLLQFHPQIVSFLFLSLYTSVHRLVWISVPVQIDMNLTFWVYFCLLRVFAFTLHQSIMGSPLKRLILLCPAVNSCHTARMYLIFLLKFSLFVIAPGAENASTKGRTLIYFNHSPLCCMRFVSI